MEVINEQSSNDYLLLCNKQPVNTTRDSHQQFYRVLLNIIHTILTIVLTLGNHKETN